MTSAGKVYLVGAGPGDPELLTVKAARLLASAELVLHDDLVPAAILALVSPRALTVNVGKRCGAKKITQAEINRLMIEKASQGGSIVRLKSGDPLVFGRAAEEMDALREAGIPFEVVPGITAAFAAAASLQCSLTDRRASSSIVFSSGHHAVDRPPETSEPTRIVYMPGRDFSGLAADWAAAGVPANLPCVAISRAAQPDQRITVTTLGALASIDPESSDLGPAPVLLLAGWVFSRIGSEVRVDAAELQPWIESLIESGQTIQA